MASVEFISLTTDGTLDKRITSGPVGSIFAWPAATPPAHALECNGALLSRTTYSKLFAVFGTAYGAGDGATTFNLPDLRGEFLRGWDHGRGLDVGRALGSVQLDELKSHTHTYDVGTSRSDYAFGSGTWAFYANVSGATKATGGAETRPRNVAVMFCIIYE